MPKKENHHYKYHCPRLCETFDNRLLCAVTGSAGATNNNALIIIINNNNSNNNNNNNNNNNFSETRKYWVDVQQGIVSSHGERDPL